MDFQSLVERKLEPTGVSNNDIIYRCPKCEGPQDSGHLYVNYDKEKFHCFKCNYRGRTIVALLKDLNIDISYDYTKLYNERGKELDDIITPTKKSIKRVVDYSTDTQILTDYYRAHTIPLSQKSYSYLMNRGLTDSMIARLGILEGVNRYGEYLEFKGEKFIGRDYSGRIMIPSARKDGLISFYVGRDFIGDKSSKYLNPPKELAVASEDVWSLDMIDTSTVIICEGVFSAISVNLALNKLIACATYGKSIAKKSSETDLLTTSQGEKLLNKKFNTYIMFYDKDALEESYSSALYLSERGANVRVVKIPEDMYGPKADAGDMTPTEIRNLILSSEPFNRFSGLI